MVWTYPTTVRERTIKSGSISLNNCYQCNWKESGILKKHMRMLLILIPHNAMGWTCLRQNYLKRPNLLKQLLQKRRQFKETHENVWMNYFDLIMEWSCSVTVRDRAIRSCYHCLQTCSTLNCNSNTNTNTNTNTILSYDQILVSISWQEKNKPPSTASSS